VGDAAPAPDPEALGAQKVVLVCVSGSRYEDALRALVRSREGAPLDPRRVAADLEQLYATGMLADARAEVSAAEGGLVLTFAVEERPAVTSVSFEGVHALTEAELAAAFHAADLKRLDPVAIKAGTEAIREELAIHGHIHASFEQRTSPRAAGVELTVVVDEGPLVKVASLDFAGARIIPAAELAKIAMTKVGEPFSPAHFERDRLVVTSTYYDRGLLDVTIPAPEITPSPDKQTVALRLAITEGKVYRIRKLAITGDVGDQAAAYRALVHVRPGEVFSRAKLIEGIQAIRRLRQKHGQGDVVEPMTELDPKTSQVDLTLAVH
jgi:outer membrane protein insertion porin family